MSKLHTSSSLLFILFFVFLLSACEKLELPGEGNTPADVAEGQQADMESASDQEAYTVAEAIAGLHAGENEDVYVVGYIVGYVQRSSIKSSVFGVGNVRTNILLADLPVETDSLRCLPVQLTTANLACKATRLALNLCDNPSMFHQKVRLKGNIDLYMGVPGLLKANSHTLLENDFDYAAYEAEQKAQDSSTSGKEGEEASTPADEQGAEDKGEDGLEDKESEDNTENTQGETGEEGEHKEDDDSSDEEDPLLAEARVWFRTHGTEEVPLTINDIKTTVATYYPVIDAAGYRIADIYVRGYIVGYYTSSNKVAHFDTPGERKYATNILLADSPDVTKKDDCIVVGLPSNSTIHSELNLYDHKKNLGQSIIIFGNIEKYGIGLGVKTPRRYTFD